MLNKFLVSSVFATALVLTPAQKAKADSEGNAIAAIVIGGLIGAAVLNEQKRKREAEAQQQSKKSNQSTAPAKRSAPAVSTAQRVENRAVQNGLNYFGYDAGPADGVFGRNTRSAIRRYQEAMGYPQDGKLSAEERDFLLESQQRASVANHDPEQSEILATEGRAGLLRHYRDEDQGLEKVMVTRAVPEAETPKQPPADTGLGLPSFNTGDASRSLNQFCNEVNILTMANGGLAAPGQLRDRNFALNEQFCLARAHAISEGNKLTTSMNADDKTSVVGRCEGLAEYMAPVIATISNQSVPNAKREIQARVDASGQSKGQLINAGRICLGSGYRVDSANIALASAAVLVVSGLPAYGEIISHHLREGLGGVNPDRKKADQWLETTLAGLQDGDTSVLGQKPDRATVLSEALTGKSAANATTAPTGALPVFKLSDGD